MMRLLYASAARDGLIYRDVLSIAQVASEKNAKVGVTGALCFGGGAFLQALEGERSAVNDIYRKIAQDARHTGCEILSADAITTRLFADWSMKMIGWDTVPTARRRAILQHHTDSMVFTPSAMTGAQAQGFLRELVEVDALYAAGAFDTTG